jgi:hypothetical protein
MKTGSQAYDARTRTRSGQLREMKTGETPTHVEVREQARRRLMNHAYVVSWVSTLGMKRDWRRGKYVKYEDTEQKYPAGDH